MMLVDYRLEASNRGDQAPRLILNQKRHQMCQRALK